MVDVDKTRHDNTESYQNGCCELRPKTAIVAQIGATPGGLPKHTILTKWGIG